MLNGVMIKCFKFCGLFVSYMFILPLLSLFFPAYIECSLNEAIKLNCCILLFELALYGLVQLYLKNLADDTDTAIWGIEEFILFVVFIVFVIVVYILMLPIECIKSIITKNSIGKDKVTVDFNSTTATLIFGVLLALFYLRFLEVSLSAFNINSNLLFLFLALCLGSFIVVVKNLVFSKKKLK